MWQFSNHNVLSTCSTKKMRFLAYPYRRVFRLHFSALSYTCQVTESAVSNLSDGGSYFVKIKNPSKFCCAGQHITAIQGSLEYSASFSPSAKIFSCQKQFYILFGHFFKHDNFVLKLKVLLSYSPAITVTLLSF